MADNDVMNNLLLTNRFKFVIDNGEIDLGYWASAQGLDVTWNVCEYRAGDQGNARAYFPGHTKYTDIQLARAACPDSQKVRAWLSEASIKGSLKRWTGSLYLGDSANQKVMQWDLNNIMPIKWAIEKFDANQAKPAMETLTFAHEGFLDDVSRFEI